MTWRLSSDERWGLRGRLVALFFGTVLLLATALLLFLPERLEHLSRRWSESRSLGISRLLGRMCAVPLEFEDARTAADMLRELEASRGASYAVLYRPDGSELTAWGVKPGGAPGPSDSERVSYAQGLVHVSVPVVTRHGERGALVLGFGLEELQERRREARNIVLIASAMLLILGIPAAFGIGAVAVAPLRRMTAVARRIATGETAARGHLPVERHDEVGTLATAFDVMLGQLYQKEAGISALAAELEQRVAERTAELESANRQLAGRLAELTRAQEQLVVANRRVSVGRLAAGVAHEINNPLAYIHGNLSYLADAVVEAQGALDGDEADLGAVRATLSDMAGAIADSSKGASRVQHIVRGLKLFSHGNDDERVPVAIEPALATAIDMASHEVKHRARVVKRVGALPKVLASEVRLSQVFLNLLVNAGQAIEKGSSEENEIQVTGYTDREGWAVVEVKDTGCGMTPEVRARLFAPFFTTKPVGVGTGLGLSISHGLIGSYGGRIEVESEPGRGSTFRVRLPPAPGETHTTVTEHAVTPQGPRRRLLVVDDEPLVCAAIRRTLGRRHDVVTVPSAAAALEVLADAPHFDRILCDLMMPGMSGAQLREELLARDPAAAAAMIFMTGGAVTESSQAFLSTANVAWLEKPLDHARLGSILDETT